MVARIDPQALHPPDLTVDGMDRLTALDVRFTQRNDVPDHGRHRNRGTQRRAQATEPQAADQAVHQLRLLGRLEPAELFHGAAQPDAASRGVNQVQGDEPGPAGQCLGSMTRCVTAWVAGSMITRVTVPPGPSAQLTLAPIANSVSSATAAIPSRPSRASLATVTDRPYPVPP